MKTIKKELDVDFIGGEGSLTVDEEKALSNFFMKRKISIDKSKDKKKRTTVQPKAIEQNSFYNLNKIGIKINRDILSDQYIKQIPLK